MPKPIANGGTASRVNLTPFVLAYIVDINHIISKIAYFMLISVSDSQSAIKPLMTIGMLISIKNVLRSCTLSMIITRYHANVPAKNNKFLRPFVFNVRLMPIRAIRKKNIFPKPTWSTTELREAGFCSATVVKTFGHIVVMPTSLSLTKPIGLFTNVLKYSKFIKRLTLSADTIKNITKKIIEFFMAFCFKKFVKLCANSVLCANEKYAMYKTVEIRTKSKMYHQPHHVKAYNPTNKPPMTLSTALCFIFLDSKAPRKIQAIKRGNMTLYPSVSKMPPIVLVNNEGCMAIIVAATNPPKLPVILLAMKNVGITAKAEINTGM